MNFDEIVSERYSVREYAEREVEEETLLKILEAGRLAPTARNQQPQHIYVVKSKEALKKLAEITPMTYGAPVVLVFTYDKDKEWHNPLEEGYTSGQQDVSIVASSIMFKAVEEGLGTVWCNYFPPTEIKKALNIADSEVVAILMPLGYPSETSTPRPMHSERKALEETVTVI